MSVNNNNIENYPNLFVMDAHNEAAEAIFEWLDLQSLGRMGQVNQRCFHFSRNETDKVVEKIALNIKNDNEYRKSTNLSMKENIVTDPGTIFNRYIQFLKEMPIDPDSSPIFDVFFLNANASVALHFSAIFFESSTPLTDIGTNIDLNLFDTMKQIFPSRYTLYVPSFVWKNSVESFMKNQPQPTSIPQIERSRSRILTVLNDHITVALVSQNGGSCQQFPLSLFRVANVFADKKNINNNNN